MSANRAQTDVRPMTAKESTIGGTALTVMRLRVRLLGLLQRGFSLFGYRLQKLASDVDHRDHLAEQMRLARNMSGEPEVIVEIGASNGRDSLTYCETAPKATVYAFEPLPRSFSALQARTATEPRLVAINAAVSDTEGEADFFETALADASSLAKPVATHSRFDAYMKLTGTKHSVRTATLDAECARRGIERINILKMDCQGAEMMVFRGARSLLERKAIDVIYVEVQFTPLYENVHLYHDLAAHLYGLGYRLHNLYGLVSDNKGVLSWGDAIFVAKKQE